MLIQRFSFCLIFFFLLSFSFAQDSLEQISPEQFQNKVLRQTRLEKISQDSAVSSEQRAFAKAASLYYAEKWETASAEYENLLKKDSLAGDILLRLAEIQLQLGDYNKLRQILLHSRVKVPSVRSSVIPSR